MENREFYNPSASFSEEMTEADMPAARPLLLSRPSVRRLGRPLLLSAALLTTLGGGFLLGQVRPAQVTSARGSSSSQSQGENGAYSVFSGSPGSPTPSPSEASSGPTQDVILSQNQCQSFEASGDTVVVVQGDDIINGTSTYDNNAQTASESVLEDGTYNVCAPFGHTDVQTMSKEQAACILGSDTMQSFENQGFRQTNIYFFQYGHLAQGRR